MTAVTAAADAYCSPPTEECIILDHGCDMKLTTAGCNQDCAALCEYHP